MNAILDALAPLGVTDLAMPATPERIWRAMREHGGGDPPAKRAKLSHRRISNALAVPSYERSRTINSTAASAECAVPRSRTSFRRAERPGWIKLRKSFARAACFAVLSLIRSRARAT